MARASVEAAVHTLLAALSGARIAPAAGDVVPLLFNGDTVGEAKARTIRLSDQGELDLLEGRWRVGASRLPDAATDLAVLSAGTDGHRHITFRSRQVEGTTIRGLLVIGATETAFLVVRDTSMLRM